MIETLELQAGRILSAAVSVFCMLAVYGRMEWKFAGNQKMELFLEKKLREFICFCCLQYFRWQFTGDIQIF